MSDRLYNLLPAVYRLRDHARGEPLRALLALMEGEFERLEDDIAGLYENWFIETCEEWGVPYLGDLLGARPLNPVSARTYSQRAYVANLLGYRRRKGTAAMLEQLARDVTGWPARAVEFFQLLATTQHLNHLRPENVRTPDLRHTDPLELVGGPFEQAAHTAEVRSIARSRGRYNIPNIGLFLWRLESYPVTRSTARPVTEPADGRYRLHPLGIDAPLYNRPQAETEITHLAEEVNVPGLLRPIALHRELAGQAPPGRYFGAEPALEVFLADHQLQICDLRDWNRPPQGKVAVDVKLGRLALPASAPSGQTVEVSYSYAFSGDLGGGPYDRRESLTGELSGPFKFEIGVTAEAPADPAVRREKKLAQTLSEAVRLWNEEPAGAIGLIAILDSRTYREELAGDSAIRVPANSQLVLVAASRAAPGGASALTAYEPGGLRPHLRGNVSVEISSAGTLVLNGLLLEGALRVRVLKEPQPEGETAEAPARGALRVAHCTLVPACPGLAVESAEADLLVHLERSICGCIQLPDTVRELRIRDCILGRGAGLALHAPGAACDIQSSTVFGLATMRSLKAGNSIFMFPVQAARRQIGCVRFCYLPDVSSRTPRRYRCQPDLALSGIDDPAKQTRIRVSVRPTFTSTQYGLPGYAQLSLACPAEIRNGAESGSEMGAFGFLQQPQRETNLRASLDEFLRVGLTAGIFFVT